MTARLPKALLERQQWAHETSDLPPDPEAVFGRLPNGVRYILKENRTPRDRVSMHLYIQCGSLAELPGEEGLAHFLEHMQFDGSTHFPPGEMVKYFQRIGMQFGPDANAHTGFAQTVYDILLPKGDAQSIAEGLLVLNDYAQGALLLPEQVEKEKKVVLAEKRSRDSADYRTLEATIDFQVPGTLVARRLPIGKEESFAAFNTDIARRFYDAWYRPERMILVLVGDFKATTALQLVEDQFAKLTPRAEARSLQEFGSFTHQGLKSFYHHERESGATSVHIETAEVRPMPADNAANQRMDLHKALADRIVHRRLDALLQEQNSVLTSASISSGYYLEQIRYAEISADCKPENWERALTLIEQTLRKAFLFGFSTSELTMAKSSFRADLQQAVNEENTQESKDLAANILSALGEWQVFQLPRQRMALLGPMIEDASLEQVQRAFADTWSAPHRLVFVTGNADLASHGQDPAEKISAVYQQSHQLPVLPPVEPAAARFPYLPEPSSSGAVASRTRMEDLGIEQVTFANGLRMVLKRTAFKENEVLAHLTFGGGRSSEPADRPGLALVTAEAANEAGFGAMDRVALENALAGRLAKVSLDITENLFAINGQAATAELPLLFQLLHACIQDPGYRSEALETAFRRLDQKYQSLSHSVEGKMQLAGSRFLAGGDSRFGWPEWSRIRQLTLEEIKAWFGSQLTQAPLELAVVGDFDPDQVVALTARYLGSLPQRGSLVADVSRPAPKFPAGNSLRLTAETKIDKAMVAVSYPTTDFWDIGRTRRLNVLSELFSERLRVRIREKLGAAYSPYAYHHAFRAYQDYGLLQAVFLVDPRQADAIVTETKTIVDEIISQGISEDELRRALDPTLAQIKDLRQSNAYWINSVLVGSTRHPEQLAWARSIEADYAAIGVAEINTLAKQYLDNRKVAEIIISPQGPAK
ncbi:MAG: insulinase family protein [Desulfatitalea sp.]